MEIYRNFSLENLENEIWKDIPNYEGHYKVSNKGRVKSLKRLVRHSGWGFITFKSKILKQSLKKGYPSIILHLDGNSLTRQTHQLVAMAFLNHKPCGLKIVVDHINNISTDNRVENLQLISVRKNSSKDRIGVSKYTGVIWVKKLKKWGASIHFNGKRIHLGNFNNEIKASECYQEALKRIENNKTIHKLIKTKTSKYKGVYFCQTNKKWTAYHRGLDKKKVTVGNYNTENDAFEALNNYKKNIINFKKATPKDFNSTIPNIGMLMDEAGHWPNPNIAKGDFTWKNGIKDTEVEFTPSKTGRFTINE